LGEGVGESNFTKLKVGKINLNKSYPLEIACGNTHIIKTFFELALGKICQLAIDLWSLQQNIPKSLK
jgi:hypothetical protein